MSAATCRIGMIVPSSNLTMETELPALLRRHEDTNAERHFTFHSSRMRLKHVTPEALRAMNAETDRCAAELADTGCDLVATACLVAIMAQGAGFHCEAERQIADALAAEGHQAPVVSSAGALIHALEAVGARRVALVTPYSRPLTELVAAYIEQSGINVADTVSLEVTDNLEVAQLDPSDLIEHAKRLDLGGCDALVLSACVQMPSLPAIAEAETRYGIPVLSAATATTYCILRALGLPTRIPEAGLLLGGAIDANGGARRSGEHLVVRARAEGGGASA
ncbi:MAG: maleate cis-trans isomerase family protein [Solirubrobacteraceae bacterium]